MDKKKKNQIQINQSKKQTGKNEIAAPITKISLILTKLS